jgi:cell fate (sporulation/competence/biofilm development) regulator YmcA (YheA/YmcA/DUF963 family)
MENMEDVTLSNALDSLDRNDFKSEAAYLEAAADLELKRSSPEFQKALMKIRGEYARREAEKQSRERAAALEEEIKHTHLTEDEDKAVLERASGEVADAVRNGRMDPAAMQGEIDKRYAAYSKQAVRDKAQKNMANAALRGMFGR